MRFIWIYPIIFLVFSNFIDRAISDCQNRIIYSQNNTLIQPNEIDIQIEKSQNFSIPLNVTPILTTPINLLLLVDVTCKNQQTLNIYSNFTEEFLQLQESLEIYSQLKYALSTFSDSSVEYQHPFMLESTFQTYISDKVRDLNFIIGEPEESLQFIATQLATTNTAWEKGAVKIILLITDNHIVSDNYTISETISQLQQNNILVSFLLLSDDNNSSSSSSSSNISSYDNLVEQLGYGIVKYTNGHSNWNQIVAEEIFKPLVSQVIIQVDSDKNNLISQLPSRVGMSKTNFTSQISVDTDMLVGYTNYPYTTYRVCGYQNQNIIINIDRAPITVAPTLDISIFKSQSNYSINIVCFDQIVSPNTNQSNFQFVNIPASDFIKILDSNSTEISSETLYQCNSVFTIQPINVGTEYITISIGDNENCTLLNSITNITFSVNDNIYEFIPQCNNVEVTLNNQNYQFQLNISEINQDIPLEYLGIIFPNLNYLLQYGRLLLAQTVNNQSISTPITSDGTIIDLYSTPVLIEFQIYSNVNIQQDSIIVPYKLVNRALVDGSTSSGGGQLINQCLINLSIDYQIGNLSLPTLDYQYEQWSQSSQLKSIPFNILSQSGSVDVMVVSMGPGQLYDFQMNPITQLPHRLLTVGFGTSSIGYQEKVSNFYINLTNSDLILSNSSYSTVILQLKYNNALQEILYPFEISLQDDNNGQYQAPVLVPNNVMVQLNQYQPSVEVYLSTDSGTSPNIFMFIEIYPINGQILNMDSNEILTIDNHSPLPSPLRIQYIPTNKWVGSDILVFGAFNSETSLVSLKYGHVHFLTSATQYSSPQVSVPTTIECFDNVSITPIPIIAFDYDTEDSLVLNILSLPEIGEIQWNNTTITSQTTIQFNNNSNNNSNTITLYYRADANRTDIEYQSNFTVSICDNNPGTCKILVITLQHYLLNFTKIIGKNQQFTLLVNNNVEFSLVDSRLSNSSNNVVLVKFTKPQYGNILYNNQEIKYNSLEPLDFSSNLYYQPNPQLTNPFGISNEVIYYQCPKYYSGISILEFNIIPLSYQYQYKGSLDMIIDENDTLIIPINNDQVENLQFRIFNFSDNNRGSILSQFDSSLNVTTEITEFPWNITLNGDGKTVLLFTPPPNESGYRFANFEFQYQSLENGHLPSEIYKYYISVMTVNDQSQLLPLYYLNDNYNVTLSNNNIYMTVSTLVTVVFDGYDKEDGSNVILMFKQLPFQGTLYQYDPSNSPTFLGSPINSYQDVVERSNDSDALFKLIYQPKLNDIGLEYTYFSVVIVDKDNSSSTAFQVIVNIVPKNMPPILTIIQSEFTEYQNTTISIVGSTLEDPDSFLDEMSLNLFVSGDKSQKGDFLKLYGDTLSFCYYVTPMNLTCKASKNYLNSFISQIYLYLQLDGEYQLDITISDIANSHGLPIRVSSSLSDQKTISIQMLPLEKDEVVDDNDKNNKIIISVVSAVGGAALLLALALIIYFFVIKPKRSKSLIPPFGYSEDSTVGVKSNPLYKSPIKQSFNPLYLEKQPQ
ncbi:Ras guanine nucleotide exchange factor [Tieghemostelium lacteum]|uniref:Ras guanine nucleotide exchange factor n=1 Tax=Tieghemostelium lacteum TaxID=361077 RepID=A0A151ZHT5_TIELA|nr:Ras guanine nucleotide exchange factor [Tieghemostelium lacteum]|eukprot:KYQ93558.1 Ras guanine nucleotide exchange factor [Tieghemostelium lacteum]